MDRSELRRVRDSIGYTQEKMAFLFGVPDRTYRYWEGKSVPAFVIRFATLLEYPEIRELIEKVALDEMKIDSKAE